MHENLYTAACLLLATETKPTIITQPAPELTFRRLLAGLVKHAEAIVLAQEPPKPEAGQTTIRF